ncbi:MAG: lipopolysaccharide biosynthesis protein [Candidatus Binataceae bacterium]
MTPVASNAGAPAASRPVLGRSIAWSYANWLAGFAAPLILIPLYVRMLGHERYGQWLVILSVASYLGLASLGSWQAVGNRIAEAVARKDGGEVNRLVSTGFIAYSGTIGAVVLAVFALTPIVWSRLMPAAGAEVKDAFYVFIALAALAFPFRAPAIMLRAFERVDLEQIIATCSNVGRIAVMAAALIAGFKLIAVALIQGGTMLASGIAAYAVATRIAPDSRPRLSRFSRSLLSSLIKPSLGFFGLTVASTLAFGIDNLVIGYAIGAGAVTQYAVPFRLIVIVSGAFATGTAALWPTITKLHASDRLDVLRRGFMLLMRLGMLFAGLVGIALWFLGPGFIRLWAGAGVFPGRATFGLQIILMIVQILLIPADAVLMATTRHYVYAALAVFEGGLNLVLSLWWVRHWGLAGVIGGTLAARMLTNGWYLPAAALSTLEIPPGRAARELGGALVVCGAAMAAVVMLWFLGDVLPPWRNLAIVTAAAETIFLAVYVLLGCTRADRQLARDLLVSAYWIRK